jgi:ABC-type transport system involved in multi-copper enzyme maturation permease subunit
MDKLMNYMERNTKAMLLSLSIMVGILLLFSLALLFCSVKLRTDLNDMIDVVVVLKESNDKLVKQLDEYTGVNDAKRVQLLKMKMAADSAVIGYFRADMKGLESMSKLMSTDKKSK